MEILLCSTGYNINYLKNKIIVRKYLEGVEKLYCLKHDERIENLNIVIKGENNEIYLEDPLTILQGSIFIEGNNNQIHISNSRYKQTFQFILPNNAGKPCHNRKVHIGKDVYLGKCFANCGNDNHEISIGDECLLAEGTVIRTVDGHTIYDNETKEILNRDDGSITIENHVWIGGDVKVLKGTTIREHSVVAMGSILTKKYNDKRVVLAGSPAKVVKRNINWSSMNTEGFKERMENPEMYIGFHNRLKKDTLVD